MLSQYLEKGSFNDIHLSFDFQFEQGSTSLKSFKQKFQSESDNLNLEDLKCQNAIGIYFTDITTKKQQQSKNKLNELLLKYSRDNIDNIEKIDIVQQRTHFITLLIIDRHQFSQINQFLHNDQKIKTIMILEEVKEYCLANHQEIDQFLLDLQIKHRIDYINSKTSEQTIGEIMKCINITINHKKKNREQKLPCLFRPRNETSLLKSEIAGITNYYQLIWLQMLNQVHGVSEAKARAIVLKYPSIKILLQAYENIPLENRPHMLSDIEVKSGIIQQNEKRLGNKISEIIYQLFTIREPEFKLFE